MGFVIQQTAYGVLEMTVNHNLTEREQEVLKLVAQGKTNKEIREELYIADCTVDTHLHNIYKKLGLFVTDKGQTSVLRLKAAMYYWRLKKWIK